MQAEAILPNWDERLARWVSLVGSPPITVLVGILLGAHASADPTAWMWAATILVAVILVPILFILHLRRKGEIADLDLSVRDQRIRPILATLAGSTIAWLAMDLGAAPRLLAALCVAAWTQTAIVLSVTLRWKISVHSMAAAGTAVMIWNLFGYVAAPVVAGVPLVAWSRVRLGRHTVAQTVAGALTGGIVMAIVLYFNNVA